jgi:hypothetical protein
LIQTPCHYKGSQEAFLRLLSYPHPQLLLSCHINPHLSNPAALYHFHIPSSHWRDAEIAFHNLLDCNPGLNWCLSPWESIFIYFAIGQWNFQVLSQACLDREIRNYSKTHLTAGVSQKGFWTCSAMVQATDSCWPLPLARCHKDTIWLSLWTPRKLWEAGIFIIIISLLVTHLAGLGQSAGQLALLCSASTRGAEILTHLFYYLIWILKQAKDRLQISLCEGYTISSPMLLYSRFTHISFIVSEGFFVFFHVFNKCLSFECV